MTEWQRLDFRMPKPEWRAMRKAINNIGCIQSAWLRVAIREKLEQPIDVQIERMRSKQ